MIVGCRDKHLTMLSFYLCIDHLYMCVLIILIIVDISHGIRSGGILLKMMGYLQLQPPESFKYKRLNKWPK